MARHRHCLKNRYDNISAPKMRLMSQKVKLQPECHMAQLPEFPFKKNFGTGLIVQENLAKDVKKAVLTRELFVFLERTEISDQSEMQNHLHTNMSIVLFFITNFISHWVISFNF